MKKPLVFATVLIGFDQAIKLAITLLAPAVQLTIIPGALYFHPVQNTNLNWFASMADFNTPIWMMVVIQFLLMSLVILAYRYFSFRGRGSSNLLSLFLSFAMAGIACSFIDVVFWGGSLDFVGLFDWFVFDTKDVFLDLSIVSLALYEIKRAKAVPGDEKRNGIGFIKWLRLGCPLRPRDFVDVQKG